MREEWLELRSKLLFETPVCRFHAAWESLRRMYRSEMERAPEGRKEEIADIVGELTIDLQSYLKRWHLQKAGSAETVCDEELEEEAEKNYAFLRDTGFKEKIAHIITETALLRQSNMMKLSVMTDEGRLNTRWGNDYASGLTAALRRGAVLATTNPPIINNERKEDPATWDRVKAALKKQYPGCGSTQLASVMTLQVVLKNCREIRPIYEATGGKYGYISLQVNPKNSTDTDRMVEEAEFLHAELKRELGGEPNVVFKLPGTSASLEAVRRLTARGIGVNVTVCFSVDQHIAFAGAIEAGNAGVSFVVNMTGRLDDPIREELQAQGVEGAAEAAKWASTAVTRRSYRTLYLDRKYKKSALLAASLRGPWNIEGSIADGDIPIYITSFPDKTREYDAVERQITARIREDIPEEALEKLMKSGIFRRAYRVEPLSVQAFDAFPPVVATLEAFAKAYDEFVAYLES